MDPSQAYLNQPITGWPSTEPQQQQQQPTFDPTAQQQQQQQSLPYSLDASGQGYAFPFTPSPALQLPDWQQTQQQWHRQPEQVDIPPYAQDVYSAYPSYVGGTTISGGTLGAGSHLTGAYDFAPFTNEQVQHHQRPQHNRRDSSSSTSSSRYGPYSGSHHPSANYSYRDSYSTEGFVVSQTHAFARLAAERTMSIKWKSG